ncbi:Mth938-like domain-containing protein [Sediminimonas qiaohouensis]|uniref:Mth938-like domain-containing protein n=1 Tax=Sediminimonas qiaohouensis TaxID=552061 RepID=UPI000410B3BB|nr:Mth938-like domain-containing protein [Sediminimonas qiaohouensis]
MELNEINFSGVVPIDGYGPGFFRVGGQVVEGAVIVTAERAQGWSGLSDAEPLIALAEQADVIFVGMGDEIAHLPAEFRNAVEEAGIGLEVMSSPAAARTYNVLLSEGRRVAAALLPVVKGN